MTARGLYNSVFGWLGEANPVHLIALSISSFLVVLLIAFIMRNPIVAQAPLSDPIVVEVERVCKSAFGPCTSCLPDAQGNINCATVTFGTCSGTQLMRETRQEMHVTRKRGEAKTEMVVLDSVALGDCEG